jgi:TRAP-type C4-dicarboxylate transport system permease small subunit
MFETRTEPLASHLVFARRVLKYASIALAVCSVALGIGILGYHYIASFSWIDSLLNASMILGGMGPMGELPSDASKVFASLYALFSGLVFISVIGIVLAPAAHRALHLFHLDEEDQKS